MACVLLVGNCHPLVSNTVVNSGHETLRAANEEDAWNFLLPHTNSRASQYPDVVVLGCDLADVDRQRLLRWLDEECDCLSVLVMNRPTDRHPDASGYYAVGDTAETALGVITRLITGLANNRPA